MRASPHGVMPPLGSFFVIPDGYPLDIVGEKDVQKREGTSQKPKCLTIAYPLSVTRNKNVTKKKGHISKENTHHISFVKHVRFWRGQTPPYKRASKYTKNLSMRTLGSKVKALR
jgi:hypothetical protein